MKIHTIKSPIYKVKWIDVNSESGWEELDASIIWADLSYGLEHCTTVGWIIHETKKYILMAASHNGAGEYGERVMIPKSLIVKKEKL